MARQDFLLTALPFLISGAIIFGHYSMLVSENPQAHSTPLVTASRIQSLKESELVPFPPAAPFPGTIVGAMHQIPTTKSELKELLDIMKAQGANTLLLRVGMTLTPDGNLILTQAAESSEDTLLRWTKKTVSDAHKEGLHTYIALMFVQEPEMTDPVLFSSQLKEWIKRWANMAQEYHVSFFLPGIILGHPTFASLPQEQLQIFVTEIEHKTREFYTGRIGIGVCCETSQVMTRGYNQLLVISKSATPPEALLTKALQDANRYGIEHVLLLELDTQRISTLKK